MTSQHPVLLLFPFLPLRSPIEFGPWWLGPVSQYQGQWLSPEFEAAARRFADSFRMASGAVVDDAGLLVRIGVGADGAPPTPEEREALKLAVGFGTIDQNPFWDEDSQSAAYKVATTDNADYWEQPLDPDGGIALVSGSRVTTTNGGLNLDQELFTVPAPLELHMPFGITLDAVVVNAMYRTLLEPSAGCEETSSHIRVATRWLLKSWQNTPSITWDDRLIFIKVATEAITSEDRNVESSKRLEAIYASAANQEGEGVGRDELLWQTDQPQFVRHWTDRGGQPKREEMSALRHWVMALGDARNALVHGEDGACHNYEVDGSPYNGSFVEVGDRVVREMIGILLGECGHPAAWRRGLDRAHLKAMRHLDELLGEEPDHGD